MKNPVGPILRMGDEVEEVIAAIRDDNPDQEIEVIDRGSYVRVQGEARVRRDRGRRCATTSAPTTRSGRFGR